METTKNALSESESIFFKQLREMIGLPIYFYGSVQRMDYFPNDSDIDVDIFSDNEASTMSSIRHFVNRLDGGDTVQFHKSIYKMHTTNTLVHGYKAKYENDRTGLKVEMSVYNSAYKPEVLYEHYRKTILPWHILCLLYFVKWMYYKCHLFGKHTYNRAKLSILNGMDSSVEFVMID